MEAFWHIIISNSVLACGLAVVAAIAARLRVSPAVVHVLLLLALLKLFTPPLLPVSVPVPGASARLLSAESLVDRSMPAPPQLSIEHSGALADEWAQPYLDASAWGVAGAAESVARWRTAEFWQNMLLALWMAGSVLVAGWYAFRIVVMCRLLRSAKPAPAFIRELLRMHSSRIGLARLPEVLALPVRITPAVWSIGSRPKIVFPAALIEEMSRDRLEMLLVHELTHIKRRDHLIRFVELLAVIVFWWHPLVWWTRRQLREMEERACDALVLCAVPHGQRTYAIALLETLEFLTAFPRPLPIIATAASPTVSLQRRFAMMKKGSHRTATRGAILFAAAVCLPAMTLALAAKPAPSDEASAGSPTVAQRVIIRQSDGEHQMVILRRSTPEQQLAEVLGLDLEEPMQRELVETLVSLGVNLGVPAVNAAEGVPGGRVLLRTAEEGDGQPMMMRLGEGENTEGKRRVKLRERGDGEMMLQLSEAGDVEVALRIMLRGSGDPEGGPIMLRLAEADEVEGMLHVALGNAENADGEPMMLRLGNGENVRVILRNPENADEGGSMMPRLRNAENAEGERRVILLKDAKAETIAQMLNAKLVGGRPMALRLGEGENAEGQRRVILLKDANAETIAQMLNAEHVDGRPIALRLGEGENADGQRRVILRIPENAEGKPRVLRLNGAEGADGERVIIRKADPED